MCLPEVNGQGIFNDFSIFFFHSYKISLSIVKCFARFCFINNAQAILIILDTSLNDGVDVIITGWGLLKYPGGSNPNKLQKVTVSIQSMNRGS